MNIKTVTHTNEYGEVINSKTFQYKGQFDEKEGYLFWNKKNYVKCFTDIEYPEELTDAEIGKLARLSKKIWGTTNMLGYRGNGSNIKPYTEQQISELIGLRLRQGKRFLSKMVRLGIMIKSVSKGTTEYYFSPVYFFSTNRIDIDLYKVCKRELDKVLNNWVKERFALQIEELEKE